MTRGIPRFSGRNGEPIVSRARTGYSWSGLIPPQILIQVRKMISVIELRSDTRVQSGDSHPHESVRNQFSSDPEPFYVSSMAVTR